MQISKCGNSASIVEYLENGTIKPHSDSSKKELLKPNSTQKPVVPSLASKSKVNKKEDSKSQEKEPIRERSKSNNAPNRNKGESKKEITKSKEPEKKVVVKPVVKKPDSKEGKSEKHLDPKNDKMKAPSPREGKSSKDKKDTTAAGITGTRNSIRIMAKQLQDLSTDEKDHTKSLERERELERNRNRI